MARQQHVVSVLNALAADLGLPAISLDADGRATVAFGDLPVTFAYRARPVDALLVYVELGDIPARGHAAPAYLLEAGFAGWSTGRMALGLDRTGRKVLGHIALPAVLLEPAALREALVAMLELALPLSERLAEQDFRLEAGEETVPAEGDERGSLRV